MQADDRGASLGEAVVAETVEACRTMFGRRLLSVYAIGSLAHGGFSALVSDIDVGVGLADPLHVTDEDQIQSVVNRVRSGASELHQRLSVFWGTPATLRGELVGGRFPPLDRLDLLEHGRLVFGDDLRGDMTAPSDTELLVVGAEFALDFLAGVRDETRDASAGLGSMAHADETAIEEIRQPAYLFARGPRRLTKIVLFPVRFLFTAATGKVGTNTVAVEHYLAHPSAPAKALVAAALSWRYAPPAGPQQALPLLDRELLALYVGYIDDHVQRLTNIGRSDLAGTFRQWKGRLQA